VGAVRVDATGGHDAVLPAVSDRLRGWMRVSLPAATDRQRSAMVGGLFSL
jgi:hypothetical protein